jgi:hypothetical protein
LIISANTAGDLTRIETYDLVNGYLADITLNPVCYTGTVGDAGGWRTCGKKGKYFAIKSSSQVIRFF